jgi:hypothetical protein
VPHKPVPDLRDFTACNRSLNVYRDIYLLWLIHYTKQIFSIFNIRNMFFITKCYFFIGIDFE